MQRRRLIALAAPALLLGAAFPCSAYADQPVMASSWLRQLLDAGPPLPARGRYSDEEVARKLGIISGRVFMPGSITRGDAAAMALRMVSASGTVQVEAGRK